MTKDELMKGPAERKNWQTGQWEPYQLPEGAVLMCDDMEQVVTCADCGSELVYGESFSSVEIQSKYGFGYAVCEQCMTDELARRRQWWKKEWEDAEMVEEG